MLFRVVKKGSGAPYVYTMPVLFLPTGEELDHLGAQPLLAEVDLLLGMWKIGTYSYVFNYKCN